MIGFILYTFHRVPKTHYAVNQEVKERGTGGNREECTGWAPPEFPILEILKNLVYIYAIFWPKATDW
jgi:hypothetical protein